MAAGEAIKCAVYDPALMAETAPRVDRIAQANAELAADDNLWQSLKEQARSILGMAGMFVVTILLAIILQPFYTMAGLEAFGEAGASQARFVILELGAILVFTALIIMLARWKKDWIIKYGILFVIFIALSYATVPLAHYIIAPFEEPTELEWATKADSDEQLMDFLGPSEYITVVEQENANQSGVIFTISKYSDSGEVPLWNDTYLESSFDSVHSYLTQDENLGFTDGNNFWFINPDTGEKIGDDNRSCMMMLTGPECRMIFTHEGSPYTLDVDGNLHRFHPNPAINSSDGTWELSPKLEMRNGYFSGRVIGEDKLLVVTSTQVVFAEIPTETKNLANDRVVAVIDHIWNFTADDDNLFTSFDWGFSPHAGVTNENNSGEQMMFLLGTEGGDVFGFDFNLSGDGEVSPAEWINLDGNSAISGEVTALRLADFNFGGLNDIFVIDDDGLKMFSGHSLVLRMEDSSTSGQAIMVVKDPTSTSSTFIEVRGRAASASGTAGDGSTDGSGWSQASLGEVNLAQPFSYDDMASLVGVLVSTVLMFMLWKHPEWYVVNTVGILVGGGVITMLGTSFVPWLIILFMVMAAVYDAWAVYHSKHMLELADTMIGLNLPILLVAPQDSGYSFLSEGDDRMRGADAMADAREASESRESSPDDAATGDSGTPGGPVKKKKKKNSQDAMFMGLGDVIFPGMLVISAMTYLAPIGGASAALLVGLGAMVGGLAGYFVLMTYVAQGRPQAGLPLLNGGAILGYLIAAVAIIGTKALEFNFTF
jgi:presenilin-like A22 family membrane protease